MKLQCHYRLCQTNKNVVAHWNFNKIPPYLSYAVPMHILLHKVDNLSEYGHSTVRQSKVLNTNILKNLVITRYFP